MPYRNDNWLANIILTVIFILVAIFVLKKNNIYKTNPEKTILSLLVSVPALIPLLYVYLVYKFNLYEILFFVEVRDTYLEYQGIQAQLGVKRALRHIHEFYPWDRYSIIVFSLTYFYSDKLFLKNQNKFLTIYFKVLMVYIVSIFISILLFLLTFILISHGDVIDWLLIIPSSAFFTISSFVGINPLYAPYALPSVIVSILVSIAIMKYKENLAFKNKNE